MKGFVLAGTHSGVGKTTVSLGLMRVLKNRGCRVAPFKVGPDYIDPMFHGIAAGEASYNLDLVMMGERGVNHSFRQHCLDKDYAVIEGVMGLFDGSGFTLDNGSTAHIARTLSLPVFLLVDAQGMAASALAHIQGYLNYDPNLEIAGIILNRVSSKGLYKYLKKPIEEQLGIPCIGYLEKDQSITLQSRHLGLVPVNEVEDFESQLDQIAERMEMNFDWSLFDQAVKKVEVIAEKPAKKECWAKGLRIGIAKDDAFNFYYQDNLELVESWGGEWVPCSPIRDAQLPDGLDALYLGGGFPEVFADDLIGNQSFIQDLRSKIEQGLPVYAECGGYIYLSQTLKQLDGSEVPMAGILPGFAEMTARLQHFGYVRCNWVDQEILAHEFHRSRINHRQQIDQVFQVTQLRNCDKRWKCGEINGSVLAGYPHLHFVGNPDFLRKLLEYVWQRKEKEQDVHEESGRN